MSGKSLLMTDWFVHNCWCTGIIKSRLTFSRFFHSHLGQHPPWMVGLGQVMVHFLVGFLICEMWTPTGCSSASSMPPSSLLFKRAGLGVGTLALGPRWGLYPKTSLKGKCHGNESCKGGEPLKNSMTYLWPRKNAPEGCSESFSIMTPLLKGWGPVPKSRGE